MPLKARHFLLLALAPNLSAQTTLEETVVVASRIEEKPSDSAGTSSAVTSEEILATGATTLTEALKYEPGVSVPFDFSGSDGLVPYLSGGDQGINIRGLEGNRISVNVDGIRQPQDFVANSFQGAGGPGRIYFDPATFSQIELYKSAASSLYGSDALGGAFSGRTESALSLLGAELNDGVLHDTVTHSTVNNSVHNRLAAAIGNGTYAASVLHSYRLGHERENNSSFPANPVDSESNAIVATLNWRPNDRWFFTATGDFFRSESFSDIDSAEGNTGQGITNTFLTSDDHRQRSRFSLDTTYTPQAGHLLLDTAKLSAYWQNARSSTDNIQNALAFGFPRNQLNEIDYETTISGLQLEANKLAGPHQLTYGLEGSYSEVDSRFIRTQFFQDSSSVQENRIGMAPSEVVRTGAFLRDDFTFGSEERWTLTPTLRVDYYSVTPNNTSAFLQRTETPSGESIPAVDYDNTSFSPSLSLDYQFTEELNGYLSWSRGTRNPTAEELSGVFTHGTDFITVPNPNLTEEHSDSFEIGLQYASEVLSTQLTGYYNNYSDFLENNVLIRENPNPGEPDQLTTVNRGEVDIYGAEFRADWLIGETLPTFSGLETGGSLSWTEGKTRGNSGEPDQPLNSVEPWKAVTYLGYNSPNEKWGTRLTATYSARKNSNDIAFDEDSDLLASESWLTLDLTAYYAISDNFRLRAGVKNLLNEKYILWATARRGSGHGGNNLPSSFYTQPGRSFFIACDLTF
jgi:hemoglobin/transferrin/lactoferrin receptor protein